MQFNKFLFLVFAAAAATVLSTSWFDTYTNLPIIYSYGLTSLVRPHVAHTYVCLSKIIYMQASIKVLHCVTLIVVSLEYGSNNIILQFIVRHIIISISIGPKHRLHSTFEKKRQIIESGSYIEQYKGRTKDL